MKFKGSLCGVVDKILALCPGVQSLIPTSSLSDETLSHGPHLHMTLAVGGMLNTITLFHICFQKIQSYCHFKILMTDIICYRMIYEIADYCVQNEVAHNFYMTKGPVFGEQRNSLKRTIRVYFWPRRKVVGMYVTLH